MSNNENSIIEKNHAAAQKLAASIAMCHCCFDTLIDKLNNSGNRRINSFSKNQPMPDFVGELAHPSVECPLFVTWEKFSSNESSWQLRGCIGCLSPRPLATDVAQYALISALKDRRFKPITLQEIQSLQVGVSLLVDYEDCQHVYDWTIGVHGILIKFVVNGQRFDGTFLPEVAKEQRWDHGQTIASLVRKAGYNGVVSPDLLNGIECTRYQSSKCKVTYREYVNVKHEGVDPIYNHLENERKQNRSWLPWKNM